MTWTVHSFLRLILPFFVSFLFFQMSVRAQVIDLKWSKPFQFDNVFFGTPERILGVGANSIFVLCEPSGLSKKIYPSYIVSLNKNTLEEEKKLALKGEETFRQVALMDKKFLKTIVTSEFVYLLWTDDNPNLINVYAEVFDAQLNQIQLLTKILDATNFLDYKNENQRISGIQVLSNPKLENEIISVIEMYNDDTGELSFGYTLANEKLIQVAEVCFPLDLKIDSLKKGSNTYAEYKYKENGFLYIKLNASKYLSNNENVLTNLFWVNTLSDQLNSETLDDGLLLYAWDVVVRKNSTAVIGLLEEKAEEENLYGLYYNSFSKEQSELDRLVLSGFDSIQKTILDGHLVQNSQEIESFISDKNIHFFFTKKEIINRRRKGQYKTIYSDIFHLNLNSNGNLKHFSVHDREAVYQENKSTEQVSIIPYGDLQFVWSPTNIIPTKKMGFLGAFGLSKQKTSILQLPIFDSIKVFPNVRIVKTNQNKNLSRLYGFSTTSTISENKAVYGFHTYKKFRWSAKSFGRFVIYLVR